MSFIILILLLVFLIPSFLAIRKQRRQQNDIQQLQANLEVGQQVVTASGMHGEVTALDGSRVTLEIAPGVTTQWERMAILRNVAPQPEVTEGEREETPALEDSTENTAENAAENTVENSVEQPEQTPEQNPNSERREP